MKALVGTFNQEKALVGAFPVIVKTGCGTDGSICDASWRIYGAQYGGGIRPAFRTHYDNVMVCCGGIIQHYTTQHHTNDFQQRKTREDCIKDEIYVLNPQELRTYMELEHC